MLLLLLLIHSMNLSFRAGVSNRMWPPAYIYVVFKEIKLKLFFIFYLNEIEKPRFKFLIYMHFTKHATLTIGTLLCYGS